MYSRLHLAWSAAPVTVTALAASSSRMVLMSAAYARSYRARAVAIFLEPLPVMPRSYTTKLALRLQTVLTSGSVNCVGTS